MNANRASVPLLRMANRNHDPTTPRSAPGHPPGAAAPAGRGAGGDPPAPAAQVRPARPGISAGQAGRGASRREKGAALMIDPDTLPPVLSEGERPYDPDCPGCFGT